MSCSDQHRKYPAACPHAVGLSASSTGTRLLSLSTIADAKISNPPWVNFQSAGWISFQSAPTLTGSYATRNRHLRQSKAIQVAISKRWHRDNPWTWQQKHLDWFLNHHVNHRSKSTRYYYLLTVNFLIRRLGKSWKFKVLGENSYPSRTSGEVHLTTTDRFRLT